MGARLGEDKIGNLSHLAGIITLSVPAGQSFNVIRIGGQQYRPGALSRTISTDVPVLLANTLYTIFAVVSGGVVQLRISANFNSVGPAGFTAWQLVGAFYSNSVSIPVFGSFINDIDGAPETEMIEGGTIGIFGQVSDPTKGTTTNDRIQWWRKGVLIHAHYEYRQSAAGSIGFGNYLLNVPTNFPINTSKHTVNTDSFSGVGGGHNAYSNIGYGDINVISGPTTGIGICQAFNSTQFRIWLQSTNGAGGGNIGGWGSNFFSFSDSVLGFTFTLEYQAQGLSNVPIRNL